MSEIQLFNKPIPFKVKEDLVTGDALYNRSVFMQANETGLILGYYTAGANPLYRIQNSHDNIIAIHRNDIVRVGGLEPMPHPSK